jgi:four helix bundle protein
MKIEKLEDLISWQKGRELSLMIFDMFRKNSDYAFRNQIERAVISITNNIAEDFERKGNREFKQFLFIAKGSCGEVRSMLYSALDLDYINKQTFDQAYALSIEIARLLSGLIKKL